MTARTIPVIRHPLASSRAISLAAATALMVALSLALPATARAQTTLLVDGSHSSCSDGGATAGSSATPFCTISAGAKAATAGTTVLVAAGTYPERVNIPASGSAGAPIVFTSAGGPPSILTGKSNGFYISGKAWITIRGFHVTDTAGAGIHVGNSSHVTIEGNDVSFAGEPVKSSTARGINISASTDSIISRNKVHHNTDSGIQLTNASMRVEVAFNVAYANARGYTRAAPGIEARSTDTSENTIHGNMTYDNEDSGIQIYNIARNNLIYNNVSYRNGDHGIDVLHSENQRIVSNSVHKNVTAGINVEGTSSGTRLRNNISVDNAQNSPGTKGNIRVDSTSTTGTTTDFDLVDQSAPVPTFVWGSRSFSSIASVAAATGQESHGLEGRPRWVDPDQGNFHLTPGSPAVDSADSDASGQPAVDIEGNARTDDPATPNTGAGSRLFDDRGAYELTGPSSQGPPDAVDDVAVTQEDDPVAVAVLANDGDADGDTLEVTSVTAPDHGTTTVGTGGTVTYQPEADYNGTDGFRYSVKDSSGQTDTAAVSVTIQPVADPPTARDDSAATVTDASVTVAVLANDDDVDGDTLSVAAVSVPDHGSASLNLDGTITYTPASGYTGVDAFTYSASDGTGRSDAATVSVTIAEANRAPTARDDAAVTATNTAVTIDVLANDDDSDLDPVTPTSVTQPQNGSAAIETGGEITYTPATGYRGADSFGYTIEDGRGGSATAIVRVTIDDPPSARLTVSPSSGPPPLAVSADASGSADNEGILSYTFDFGDGTVVGPQPAPTASHTYATGGTRTVVVTVTDTLGLQSTATATVSVAVNLVGNAGFELGTSGWSASPSTLDRVVGGHSGDWSAKVSNPSTASAACSLNDSPNWAATSSSGRYLGSMWVRGDAPGATIKIRLREYKSGTLTAIQTTSYALTADWRLISTELVPVNAGTSTIDFNAYIASAPPGTCFYADDVSLTLS